MGTIDLIKRHQRLAVRMAYTTDFDRRCNLEASLDKVFDRLMERVERDADARTYCESVLQDGGWL